MPYRALAAAQHRDDHTTRLRPSRRQIRATDLGADDEGWSVLAAAAAEGLEPWQAAAIREGFGGDIPNATILIGFNPTWDSGRLLRTIPHATGKAGCEYEGGIIRFDPAAGRACPCCRSTPRASTLAPHEVCVCCHGTRRRPRQTPQQLRKPSWETLNPGRAYPLRDRMRRLDGGTGRMPSRPEIRPRPIEPETTTDDSSAGETTRLDIRPRPIEPESPEEN